MLYDGLVISLGTHTSQILADARRLDVTVPTGRSVLCVSRRDDVLTPPFHAWVLHVDRDGLPVGLEVLHLWDQWLRVVRDNALKRNPQNPRPTVAAVANGGTTPQAAFLWAVVARLRQVRTVTVTAYDIQFGRAVVLKPSTPPCHELEPQRCS